MSELKRRVRIKARSAKPNKFGCVAGSWRMEFLPQRTRDLSEQRNSPSHPSRLDFENGMTWWGFREISYSLGLDHLRWIRLVPQCRSCQARRQRPVRLPRWPPPGWRYGEALRRLPFIFGCPAILRTGSAALTEVTIEAALGAQASLRAGFSTTYGKPLVRASLADESSTIRAPVQ
jgi:hypothetical protein